MDQTQISTPDPYARSFQMDAGTLDVMATRLEARGKHPFFQRAIGDYMSELALDRSARLLDLGCGTGVAARAIARRPEIGVPIIALDISPHLVEAGRRFAEIEGLAELIDFRVGDAHTLQLPDGGFDVVVMHTLLSHVADPALVLAEGRRLLRPDGRMVVFDGDYASLTIGTDAPDGGDETDRLIQRTLIANHRVMRAMPRLMQQGGLALAWSRGYLVSDIGRMDFWAAMLASLRVLMPKAGVLADAEANAFVDAMERASAAGRFFGACNFYTFIARRDRSRAG
ncbi:MAG: methyltransferase domain-containing protein [Acetobacteraceae bacterium]|nr:methyltransferase domain-containing protein [Acetobacteraceae bacterium]